jgi:two-component system sensor histidine kinase/response regulator
MDKIKFVIKKCTAVLFLCLSTINVCGQSTDMLYTQYKNASQDQRIVAADKVFRSLCKDGYSDTLRIFTTSMPQQTVKAYIDEAMSQWYLDKGNYHESIRLATDAAQVFISLPDSLYMANCYATLSIDYLRIGDLKLAISYAQKCYRYDLKSGDKGNISSSLSNIAGLYLTDNHPLDAETYILKSIDIEKELKRDKYLAIRYGLASEIYTSLHQYNKAIKYAFDAYHLDMSGKREDKAGIRLAQLASALDAKGDKHNAESTYLKAIALLEKHNVKVSLAITYNQLGTFYQQHGNNAQAIVYLRKAVKMSNEIDNKMEALKSYTALADLLEKSSPAEAIACLKAANDLRQKIYQDESENQINRFNIEFETQEKEAKIAEQNAQIASNKYHQMLMLIGLLCCIAVIAIAVIMNRQQRKRNLVLTELNRLKDRFDSLIAHDLKNPVVAQKNTLDIMVENFDAIDKDDFHEMCVSLKDSSTSMLNLLYNLLDWSRLKSGRMLFTPSSFPLIDITREVQALYNMNLKRKNITLNVSVPTDAIVVADRNMIATVVRNLVNNSIKFSHDGGHIDISATHEEHKWLVAVSDNGIGMKQETIDKILNEDFLKSSNGTNGELGTGLGLAICRKMIEYNGSTLAIASNDGEGSKFSFTLKENE